MTPSVLQGLSGRPVAEGRERDVLNNEVRPVLDATRAVVNYETTLRATTTSADSPGIAKRIWESEEVPTTGTWMIEARLVGTGPAGAALGAVITTTYRFDAGAVTQVGATTLVMHANILPATPAFSATASRTIYLAATDDGSGLVTWVAVIRVLEVIG